MRNQPEGRSVYKGMNTKARIARRITLLTVVAAVCAVMAYGVGWAVRGESLPWEDSHPAAAQQRDDKPVALPDGDGTPSSDPSATPSDGSTGR